MMHWAFPYNPETEKDMKLTDRIKIALCWPMVIFFAIFWPIIALFIMEDGKYEDAAHAKRGRKRVRT